tara:strand:- start:106 stop:342 length:237 start_codon:yes stop_codon:yes gene_type:complete
MLRLVAENESVPRTPEFSKGWMEGLRRIVGLTSGERSRGEWEALLMIFRWVTKDLEVKVASFNPKGRKLRIVDASEGE